MGAGGVLLVALALAQATFGHLARALLALLGGLVLLQTVATYLYSTRRGKFEVWAELLDDLHLRGDEHVLDMGCGLGAILAIVAELVPHGRAVGLDLWRSVDQSGNSLEAAQHNLRAEGVSDRCELKTGDMMALPFPDATFDLVVSNLAIHNVAHRQGRLRAVDEAVRVLKPGGRLLIADLTWTRAYAKRLREQGLKGVEVHNLGWRFWYGTLGIATGLVVATKRA
jgi:arsenite methyltransferase